MKNWLKIGEFAKQVGVSTRTLRLFEEARLIVSHIRGENGYRYYTADQIPRMQQILKFKKIGFELAEIKSLIESENSKTLDHLRISLGERLTRIQSTETDLAGQKIQIQKILTSLEIETTGLKSQERKYIMNTRGHVSNELQHESVSALRPDTVVILSISAHTPAIEAQYLRLFTKPGAYMTTVFNADDRLSVLLADNETIRQGRTFYFSKNQGLKDQIQKIGGVMSDGDLIAIFGLNLAAGPIQLPLSPPRALSEETSLLAALTSVLDIGLSPQALCVAPVPS